MKDIIFDNVSKSYGDTNVIKDLDMKIKDGERLVILGPSGLRQVYTFKNDCRP